MQIPSVNQTAFDRREGKMNGKKYPFSFKKTKNKNNHGGNSSSNGYVTGITKEELINGSSQSSSAERGGNSNSRRHSSQVMEQEHSLKIDTGKSNFNALLSKFGGGGNEKRQPSMIPKGDDGDGDDREEPFRVIAPQPSIIAEKKALSQWRSRRKNHETSVPSTKNTSPENDTTTARKNHETSVPSTTNTSPENDTTTNNETPPPPSPKEYFNSSSPGKSETIPNFPLKARQSKTSSSVECTSQSQSHQQKHSQQQQQSKQPQSRPRQQNKPKSHLTHHPQQQQQQQQHNGHSKTNNYRKTFTSPPKSHQRLILEQVAAQYFLNDTQQCNNNARYVGATYYGSNGSNSVGGGGSLGSPDENTNYATDAGSEDANSNSQSRAMSGNHCTRNNKDREAVISFLDVNNDGGEHDEAARSSKKSAAEQSQDIQRETNIDAILEMASDHLSLGKNDLALTAYRHAMKCAFDDVISVKQKLVEVKQKRQPPLQSPLTNTNAEELTFELSLLQVASRVADIHNNMGVVHEMNRHYEKAKSSYVDALEVYHNTCKRFEEKGDIDVDRTRKNVERMAAACASEQERRGLHDTARRTAKQVEREQHFARRRTLLREAIGTLQRALELEGSTIGLSHPVAASTLIQIGKYHYEIREYDEAVREIRRAILILKNALGRNHPQVGKSTLLLASIYERHGESVSPEGTAREKDNLELELYVDALEPLKATLGEVHPEVAFLYVKIGYLYGKKGDLSLSLLAYKAALKAYGEPFLAAVVGGGGIHQDVASVWVRVTEHLTSLRSWDEVVVAGRRSLFLLRRAKNALFQVAYQPSSGASSTSSQPLSPSVARSSKKSHIEITSDTYYDSLYTILQCVGQAHTSLSNYALARDACSESLRIAWKMTLSSRQNLGSSPNKESLTNVLKVIRALKRLGKAYLLEKHYTPALECFLPSLELLRSSKETESTLDTASVLGSLGFLYLKLKKYTESSNFFRECLRLYQRNGVDTNDRETRKVMAWLEMAESKEEELSVTPPIFLEIPTIVFQDEI